jgi:hypothetical protein
LALRKDILNQRMLGGRKQRLGVAAAALGFVVFGMARGAGLCAEVAFGRVGLGLH